MSGLNEKLERKATILKKIETTQWNSSKIQIFVVLVPDGFVNLQRQDKRDFVIIYSVK